MCENRESALINASVYLNDQVAKDIYRMILATSDWRGEDPLPGQFLMLRVTNATDPLLARPFGISGFKRESREAEVEVLYRVVGRGTRIMEHWRPGWQTAFLGPLGNGFTLPQEGSSSLLIAGGVGLPPLLALARTMKSFGREKELCLLYGDMSRDRIIDPGSPMFPDVEVITCTEDGSCGTRGLVTDLLKAKDYGQDSHVFACGPNAMMKAVMNLTTGRCATAQYSLEARMACGFGVCSGCAIKQASGDYVRVCREGPVFGASDLALHSFKDV